MDYISKHCCCLQSTENNHKIRKYHLKSQVAVMTVVLLVALNHGMSTSHAAVLVPQIQAENGTLQIHEDDASWIASLYNFASPLGGLTGGILIEFFGRRCSIMIALGGTATSYIMIFLSQSSGVVMVGRCLEGISKTMAATAVAVLMDENLHPTCRGLIFPQYSTMLSFGIFAMMGLATLMSWRMSSLLAAGLSVVSCISVFLVPETPAWLVRKGHLLQAQQALRRLWGPSRQQQANEIFQNLRRRYVNEGKSPELSSLISSSIKTLLSPGYLKPFLIIHTINVFIQLFCGNHLVINYSVDMISRMAEDYDPYVINTIFSLIRAVVCFIAGITLTIFGRRTSMMISGIGSAISSVALAGVLFTEMNILATPEVRQTLSIILLGAYVIFFSSGYYTIPAMMIGETQPAAVRGYICGYIYTINDFTSGGVIKVYPWLLRTLGLHGMFLMFGVSCCICVLICYLFLPETNGKTLEEIEDYFKQKNIMWINRNKSSTERSADFPEAHHLHEEDTSFSGS